MPDQIDDFVLKAIEIAEARFGAIEVAKLALRQYAGGRHCGADPATYALKRIEELERQIGDRS